VEHADVKLLPILERVDPKTVGVEELLALARRSRGWPRRWYLLYVLTATVGALALPIYAAGGAHADCSSPSDTCTNSETRYLQALQNDGFDVSDGKANDWFKMAAIARAGTDR
jgi:hypothetical protein